MVSQPTPGDPVYTVKSIAGGRTRVLHRNLLLPLQGEIRQEIGMRGEGISGSEDEEEGGDQMPKVARAPYGRPRGTTGSKASPSQQRETSGKDTSAGLSGQKTHSLLVSPFSPEHMSGDEDSSEDEVYTDSFTLHTTASDSTTASSVHHQWKTIVVYSLLILVQQKVILPLICPILRGPHNLIRQQIVFLPNSPVILILVIEFHTI